MLRVLASHRIWGGRAHTALRVSSSISSRSNSSSSSSSSTEETEGAPGHGRRRAPAPAKDMQQDATPRDDSAFRPLSVFYNGALSRPLRLTKLISVAGCGTSVALTPLISIITDGASLGYLAGALLVTFSFSTTAMLKVISSPYVLQMGIDKGSSTTLRAQTLNLFAQPVWTSFTVQDMAPAESILPFVTFKAANTGKLLYVQMDNMPDDAVLQQSAGPVAVEAVAAMRGISEAEDALGVDSDAEYEEDEQQQQQQQEKKTQEGSSEQKKET